MSIFKVRRVQREERGIAMVTALLVTMVSLTLSLIAFQLTQHSMDSSAGDRKRVQSVHAAEAGLDYAFQQLQAGVLQAAYPASGTISLQSNPTTATFSVAATYYSTYPPSGSPLASPYSGAAAAELASTGNTTYSGSGKRVMRALVRLTAPTTTSVFNDAIYSKGTIDATNGMTINQSPSGAAANVYSDTNDVCSNGMTVQGHLYVNGTINWTNSCHVTTDVIARGNVLAVSNNSTINGNLTSSTGTIANMTGTVTGYEKAAGTISSGGTHGALYPNTPTSFPAETFPSYNWVPADWTSNGFVESDMACTAIPAFIAGLSTSTTKYVIRATGTPCALKFSGTYSLKRDIAIITDSGLDSTSTFTIINTDTGPHTFYLIVPSNASPAPACGKDFGDIMATNTVTFTNFRSFFYTPCNVKFTNNVGMAGQIYAGGTTTLTNGFVMTFIPADTPGAIQTTYAYNVEIGYIREEAR